jgi:hypothetical protein
MANRGPLSAAKRKRELDKREKRQAKQERRLQRAAERAQAREAAPSDTSAREDNAHADRV